MQNYMNHKVNKHEDHRRRLDEWIDNIPVKSVKTIYVREKAALGNHYHDKKDEIFYVAKGKGNYVLTTSKSYQRGWLFEGEALFVKRGTIHTFTMWPDSILLEAATEPYDPLDEIRA